MFKNKVTTYHLIMAGGFPYLEIQEIDSSCPSCSVNVSFRGNLLCCNSGSFGLAGIIMMPLK